MSLQRSNSCRHAATRLLGLSMACAALTLSANGQATQHYKETPLVSNLASLAPTVDTHLVNPWGLARSSGGPWWTSDNGPGLSTLYNGTGGVLSLVVTVPSGDTNSSPTGTPTGIVFNGDSTVFPLNGKAAAFLFATEDGTVSAWNGGASASIVINQTPKSVFKGLTIASTEEFTGKPATFLYVADFRRGQVEVFDSNYKPVPLYSRGNDNDDDHDNNGWAGMLNLHSDEPFADPHLPAGYAPFNIQNIGGDLYVAFAKQDSAKHDEVAGAGLGYVDVFSPSGRLLRRLEHGPWFNAPWGLVMASSDFGSHSHDILVGQFGSGQILAFDHATGKYRGTLMGTNDQPLVIDGLWGIAFGNGASAGPATTLYFAAGVDDEKNGLFGSITAVENPQGGGR